MIRFPLAFSMGLVFSLLCVQHPAVHAQEISDPDLFIQQVSVSDNSGGAREPWERAVGSQFENFDGEEIRQRLMSLFGVGLMNDVSNLGFVGQLGENNIASVVQSSGSENQAVVVQSNSGEGSGFVVPGQGDPDPPPFHGGEAGGNTANVVQAGSDHTATVLQGVTDDDNSGDSQGMSSKGNSGATPPPFGSDGSGDFEAVVEQVGERNTSTVVQSGSGLLFNPPGNGTGNGSPPPFEGNGYGGSQAELAQDGFGNSGLIVQYGNEHLAEIFQYGSENISEILLSGQHNTGTVSQEGDFNKAFMSLAGEDNTIHVGQFGNDNYFNLGLTGDNNFLDLIQNGDDNQYDREYSGNAVLNETVTQDGNGNNAKQIGSLSNGRSANILQEGSGMEVIIRHGL